MLAGQAAAERVRARETAWDLGWRVIPRQLVASLAGLFRLLPWVNTDEPGVGARRGTGVPPHKALRR